MMNSKSKSTGYNTDNSTISLNNATISGDNNKIIGSNNNITGDNNDIIGNNNNIVGDNNSVKGDTNNLVGDNCDARGNENSLVGDNCAAKGLNNKVSGSNSRNKSPKTVLKEMKNHLEGNNSTGVITFELAKLQNLQNSGIDAIQELSRACFPPFKVKWDTGIIKLNEEGHRELEEFMKHYEEC